jgi:hypothetical protein
MSQVADDERFFHGTTYDANGHFGAVQGDAFGQSADPLVGIARMRDLDVDGPALGSEVMRNGAQLGVSNDLHVRRYPHGTETHCQQRTERD